MALEYETFKAILARTTRILINRSFITLAKSGEATSLDEFATKEKSKHQLKNDKNPFVSHDIFDPECDFFLYVFVI